MAFLTTLNQRIAVVLTRAVGTMWCAYAFVILALAGFPGLGASPTQYVQWTSQTLIQLAMLSVIMVGQQILNITQAEHHAQNTQLHQQSHAMHAQSQAMHLEHRDAADQIAGQITALRAQVAALAVVPAPLTMPTTEATS